jgi:hypothetical protein
MTVAVLKLVLLLYLGSVRFFKHLIYATPFFWYPISLAALLFTSFQFVFPRKPPVIEVMQWTGSGLPLLRRPPVSLESEPLHEVSQETFREDAISRHRNRRGF